MKYELMPKEIEVYPVVAWSTFWATQNIVIELTSNLQILDRYCEVEGSRHGLIFSELKLVLFEGVK